MSTKEFTSADGIETRLSVGRADGLVELEIVYRARGVSAVETNMDITISPDRAPALCLAILEAAGYVEGDKMAKDAARSHFGDAVESLAVGVGEQGRVTAEAKEQAELEAEALELYGEWIRLGGGVPHDNWEQISKESQFRWLAVARKAREMRAGK